MDRIQGISSGLDDDPARVVESGWWSVVLAVVRPAAAGAYGGVGESWYAQAHCGVAASGDLVPPTDRVASARVATATWTRHWSMQVALGSTVVMHLMR